MCVVLYTKIQCPQRPEEPEEGMGAPAARVSGIVRHLMWILRLKLGFSARTICALND